jgi:translation initiation factor 1
MRKAGMGGLVYSTEGGRMCPACRQPVGACRCDAAAASAGGDGIVRVSRETKGRGGKAVTVVRGTGAQAPELGKQLRTLCGSGGTVKDGAIEVQGDHCDRVVAFLKDAGWTVKRSGG